MKYARGILIASSLLATPAMLIWGINQATVMPFGILILCGIEALEREIK